MWTANTEWLAYENGVWTNDDGKSVERAMHTTVRLIELEVELYDDEEMQDACIGWAKRSESNGKESTRALSVRPRWSVWHETTKTSTR